MEWVKYGLVFWGRRRWMLNGIKILFPLFGCEYFFFHSSFHPLLLYFLEKRIWKNSFKKVNTFLWIWCEDAFWGYILKNGEKLVGNFPSCCSSLVQKLAYTSSRLKFLTNILILTRRAPSTINVNFGILCKPSSNTIHKKHNSLQISPIFFTKYNPKFQSTACKIA